MRPDRSRKAGRRAARRSGRAENGVERSVRPKLFIPYDIDEAVAQVCAEFGATPALITRRFLAGPRGEIEAALAYMDGLADKDVINNHVLRSIMIEAGEKSSDGPPMRVTSKDVVQGVLDRLLSASEAEAVDDWKKVLDAIATGDTVLFFNGSSRAIVVSTPGWAQRTVLEPPSETVVRGPRDGFTETIRVNESLVRRRIKHPDLRFEQLEVGRYSKTKVSVGYIKGVTSDAIVEEVLSRIRRIDVDAVLESGYLEEYIQDDPWSFFPQVVRTERPDTVAAALLEGRVVIMTDNTPFVLIVPATFSMFLSSPEDYYERFPIGSLIRILRYIAFVSALILPGLYIAITTYHQEILPTDLILAIAAARQGVPFPALVEALLLETLFEVLREAGIRLPRVIGQAVSIVGALVVGEAAVNAGLVSPAMVIVVAMTAIASFATPVFSFAISARILRFVFMLAAATVGLFGIQIIALLLLLHLVSLRSFGVPYLSPITPLHMTDIDDVITRVPIWSNIARPESVGVKNPVRQDRGQRPRPPDSGYGGRQSKSPKKRLSGSERSGRGKQ